MTPKTLVTKETTHNFQRFKDAVLLTLALAVMVGCQGFSSSGSGSQQMGNLALGTAVSFGNVAPGSSKTLTVTAMNSGSEAISIQSVAFSSKYFTLTSPTLPVSVAGGQSAALSLKFSPNATGQFNATLSVGSNALDAQTSVSLTGMGSTAPSGSLTVSPANEAFGSVADGTTQSQTVTLSNPSSTAVDISQIAVAGTGFQISGISVPLTLNASQSTTFTVSFSPQTSGSASGTVTIASDASDSTLGMTLSGTGVTPGELGASATTVSFGSVTVNTRQTTSETITNTGSSSVTISQVAASGSGFSVSGIATPMTLGAGQGATFSVSFDPSTAASDSGSVTVTSNAANPTLTIPLSGTGTAAPVGILGSSPASIGFGSVQVNTPQSTSEIITNTGTASVTISQVAASGTGFSVSGIATPVVLGAGQSTSFSVSFDPTTAATDSGSITVVSNASNSTLSIPLSGTGTAAPVGVLGSSPASISFGSVQLNTPQATVETITNTGNASVTISQVAASGTGFSVSGIATPVILTAGQSASFSVSFDPTTAATDSGNVTVTSNASNPTLSIPLSGTGLAAGALGSSPSSMSFGSVTVNTKQSSTATVTNNGGSSVTISQVVASGSGFSVSGISTPVTLTAGQSTSFSVSFDPSTAASDSGSVSVTSNASNPTLTIPLSGTGTPAPVGTLGSSPASISFGSVQVNTPQSTSETITNTGNASVTISQVAASGTGFSVSGIATPVTLTAGQSTSFSVSFDPTTAATDSGSVTVTSNASNPTMSIALSGTGTAAPVGTLGSSPTSISFGSTQVNTPQSTSETITNTGNASVTISQIVASGTGFSVSGIATPVTLTAGQSTSFSVSFDPTTAATDSGSVTVTSNASNPTLTIGLTGTGTAAPGQLAASPATIAVGSVVDGTTGSGTGSLTASGASVTVTGASSSNSAFTITGLTLPVTIGAGQSLGFSVTFSPQTTGSASATLTFTSNATPGSTTASATGTGTAAPTHTVSLSWTASSSSDISGYNVYRAVYSGSSCGTFAKINPALTSSTVYSDSTVTDGTNYCYAATTVNTSNQESGYSNVVSNVQIPAP